jgi:hypothetical protein
MGAGPDQENFRIRHFIDQKPVRLDVALPRRFPFARQFVRLVFRRQGARLSEQLDGRDKFLDVFAAPLLASQIISESPPLCDSPHAAMSE